MHSFPSNIFSSLLSVLRSSRGISASVIPNFQVLLPWAAAFLSTLVVYPAIKTSAINSRPKTFNPLPTASLQTNLLHILHTWLLLFPMAQVVCVCVLYCDSLLPPETSSQYVHPDLTSSPRTLKQTRKVIPFLYPSPFPGSNTPITIVHESLKLRYVPMSQPPTA